MYLQYKSFENTMGKGEIAQSKQDSKTTDCWFDPRHSNFLS